MDLTTHTILDLLPDREVQTAAAWMRKHPEIEVVSRDRGEDYAAAARLGAPQATQCADRFHLAQNLTKIVEEILARCRGEIRKALKTETTPLAHPTWNVLQRMREYFPREVGGRRALLTHPFPSRQALTAPRCDPPRSVWHADRRG